LPVAILSFEQKALSQWDWQILADFAHLVRAVIAGALSVWKMGKELSPDEDYFNNSEEAGKTAGGTSNVHVLKPHAKTAVFIFGLAILAIVDDRSRNFDRLADLAAAETRIGILVDLLADALLDHLRLGGLRGILRSLIGGLGKRRNTHRAENSEHDQRLTHHSLLGIRGNGGFKQENLG